MNNNAQIESLQAQRIEAPHKKDQNIAHYGIEGQRTADLGDGTFLNPIVPGDHPDPTILKDGVNYYLTFSSFWAYPGIVIWHSKDLVNWRPICAALNKPIGSVWALDLVKYNQRYFIYIPALREGYSSIYVIYADDILGPWSEPIDLKLPGCIDPGHAVGEDGKRYLFVNGIRRVGLSDDGLSTVGTLEHVYTPWRYPDDWVVEMFAPEGPKFVKRGDWFYLISAVGGTSGPPTSHMVIVARSRSIHGPWEDCPHNPIVHTESAAEPWWSRGHATLVEGPGSDWWLVYHGYENGFRTLGRQTLLEPVEWTNAGWFLAKGGDLSKPIQKPKGGVESPAGFALSDNFSQNKLGIQWSLHHPDRDELSRVSSEKEALVIQGKGISPADCSPLTFIVGDHSYEVEVSIEPREGAQGGLILYYNERMFCGIGFSVGQIFTYHYGEEHSWLRCDVVLQSVRVRLTNVNHVITYHYSIDGGAWIKHPWQMEVSGMHHNVLGGFSSLKVGIYSSGKGTVTFKRLTYRGLNK